MTTPESVSLLLARADARERLASVRLVVVDEWHELVGNKRGVQVQLALARLSGWNPALQVWGMSATLGNLEEALHTLLPASVPGAPQPPPAVLVQGRIDKRLEVQVMLPARADRFAWAGHMGLSLLPQVVQSIEAAASTLVFTNTRSQAERWYQALLEARPDWAGTIALHHGSLGHEVRDWVEQGLKAGQLKAVVCTSSLDLGVDFLPVEQVLQIGSAKGVARLVQRAAARAMRRGAAPASRWCPRTAWSWWRPPPRATRWRRAALKTGTHRVPRWTCWCSTWSPWRWAAALCPMYCWPKCAAPRPMRP